MSELENMRIPDDLAGLLGGTGTGGTADTSQAVLDQLAGGDPRWQLVTRLLEQRTADAAGEDPLASEDQADRPDPRRRQARRAALRRLAAELDILRRRNDVLADALGACPECWGSDLACDTCGGAGRPGSDLPDPALFAAWVAPAVHRVRAEARRSPHRTPSATTSSTVNQPVSEGVDT